jgi:nucleoside-diphosphate-sugar epimerase
MPPTHLILGCGYLGRVVARRWLAHGHRVAAVTRSRADELRSLGIEPIVGDVTDSTSLTLPAADTVLYAVGLDRSAGNSMREVYVRGLANVLDALPAPRRFVYVSSTSVYGQTDGSWVDESSPTEPADESGRIVLECERLLRGRLPGAIVLRFAGIYGPGRIIKRAALEKGEPLATDPDKRINLIQVEDGARIVVAAAERGQLGTTFNVADGHPVTRREFYTTLAEFLGAPQPKFEPPPGSASRQDRTDRRVNNRRMLEVLKVELQYPDFRAGLKAATTF